MGIFDGFWSSLVNNNMTGWLGETFTEFEIMFTKFLGHKGEMLRNVYIPKDDGTTSEIDVLYITKKGIFVIESKNYSGWIFGDEHSQYWTASLPNKQKNRFYNPIKQNQSHIKWLNNYLKDDSIPLHSIIAFSERCTLKKVPDVAGVSIVNRDELFLALKKVWAEQQDSLTEEKVKELKNHLSTLTKADAAVKEAHVDNINKKYKNMQEEIIVDASNNSVQEKDVSIKADATVKEAVENVAEATIKCPKCGSDMVLRTAKKGNNAGNQFYGCSAFPKCRYVMDI